MSKGIVAIFATNGREWTDFLKKCKDTDEFKQHKRDLNLLTEGEYDG